MQPWRLDRSRQCHCEPRIGVKQSQSNDLAMSSITPSAGTPRNAPPILSCPRHFLSFSPIRQAQGRLRRGSPILLSGIFFNKSLPRCEHSLARRFTSFDCSLEKLTSRSKNKSNGYGLHELLQSRTSFAGKNRCYRRKLL